MRDKVRLERLESLAERMRHLTEEQEEILFLRMGAFIDGIIYATGKLVAPPSQSE